MKLDPLGLSTLSPRRKRLVMTLLSLATSLGLLLVVIGIGAPALGSATHITHPVLGAKSGNLTGGGGASNYSNGTDWPGCPSPCTPPPGWGPGRVPS